MTENSGGCLLCWEQLRGKTDLALNAIDLILEQTKDKTENEIDFLIQVANLIQELIDLAEAQRNIIESDKLETVNLQAKITDLKKKLATARKRKKHKTQKGAR